MASVKNTGPIVSLKQQTYTGYQFYAQASIPGKNAAQTLRFLVLVMQRRADKKLGEDASNILDPAAYLNYDENAFRTYAGLASAEDLFAAYMPGENPRWAMHLREPDDADPGCFYTTDIALRVADSRFVEIRCRTRVTEQYGTQRSQQVYRPSFVKTLLEKQDGVDIRLQDRAGELTKEPLTLSNNSAVDKTRQAWRRGNDPMPYVFVPDHDRKTVHAALAQMPDAASFSLPGFVPAMPVPNAPAENGMLALARRMARHLYGYAHIFFVPEAALEHLKNLMPRQPRSGCLFAMMPDGVMKELPVKDVLALPEKSISDYVTNIFHMRRCPDLFDDAGSALALKAELMQHAGQTDVQNLQDLNTLLTGEKNRLEQINRELTAMNGKLQKSNLELNEKAKKIRKVIREECEKENREKLRLLQERAEAAERERDEAKNDLYLRQQEIAALRQSGRQKDAERQAEESLFVIERYESGEEGLAAYFGDRFSDRIAFAHTVKNTFVNCKIALSDLWKALYALAIVMWELKYGKNRAGGNILDQFKLKTGIEVSGESGITHKNPDQMRQFDVTYHDRSICAEFHLKIFDGRLAAADQNQRIYFGFCDDEKIIVIDTCGEHKENASTRHMS